MHSRCLIVAAFALWLGGSGCTTTARRTDSPTALGSRLWGEPPEQAPPQRQVALPPEREEPPATATVSAPTGLSKYFPGLRHTPVESPDATPVARTTWFSFLHRPKPTQMYMTDARAGLTQGMTRVAALPVAIQIPTDRASDASVTPAKAEQPAPSSGASAPTPDPAPPVADPSSLLPSLDSAAETAGPAVLNNNRPELPGVDPRERPRLSSMSDLASTDSRTPSSESRKSDDRAIRAVPEASEISATSEPMTLAGFFRKLGSKGRATPHIHTTTIHASPQSLPTPQVAPKPVAKPSPQVVETDHACVCDNCGAKIAKKKPCILKRMRKAVFQGGTPTVTASAQH